MFDSRRWSRLALAALLGAALILISTRLPSIDLRQPEGGSSSVLGPFTASPASEGSPFNPLFELLKLVSAGLVGISVNSVQRRSKRDNPLSRSVEHGQILLCVAAALMMIIIGNSVARALGIAGIASIVRFRSPVDDTKDAVIFIMLLGLGMACGIGALSLAGMGTVFVCMFLILLDEFTQDHKFRQMMLELVSASPVFPTEHVHHIFAAYRITYEPREVIEGDEVVHKYWVTLPPDTRLEYLSDHLTAGGAAGLKAVAWSKERKP